jgi:hypothetical protein
MNNPYVVLFGAGAGLHLQLPHLVIRAIFKSIFIILSLHLKSGKIK